MSESNGPTDEPSTSPDAQPTESATDPQPAEPAAPEVGYWQQQAENAPPPPSPGIEFNPQSGYAYGDQQGQPSYAPPSYTPPPSYPDPAAQQPGYEQQPGYQQPYEQQGYGQQQPYGYPQQGYPPQQSYGYPQQGYAQPYQSYVPPNHPRATTALVLGLVSTVGALMCFLPLLVSPFAWVYGQKTRKEIRDANGQVGGEGMANAGMILGIIGTAFLAIAVVVVVIIVIVAVSDPTAFDDGSTV